jgi:hypothetical protein
MPESRADELSAVARAAGEPISEVIRIAIEREIAFRRADPSFQAQRKQLLEHEVAVIERLTPPEDEVDDA